MVIIMRGVPGSGKSHWSKNRLIQFQTAPDLAPEAAGQIVSADDYRMRSGKYVFDPKETAAAHEHCFSRAYEFLERSSSHDLLIVDNTNISNWEMTPYVCLARYHGHKVVAVQVKCSLGVAFERNKHDVPLDVITRMHNDFEHPKTIEHIYAIDGEKPSDVHIPW